MKKEYFAPEMNEVVLKLEGLMVSASDDSNTGAGFSDGPSPGPSYDDEDDD